MLTAEFDYALPPERIAQEPLAQRDSSRMLVVDGDGSLHDRRFVDLPELLRPGDLLVVNDTRVRHARLRGETERGREVEVLVVERRADGSYLCLTRPAKHVQPGACVRIGDELEASVIAVAGEHAGARLVRFHARDVEAAIERAGAAPLPPYIHRHLNDPERYQTLYARGAPSSAAAPTAGLHFTPAVRERLQGAGIHWSTVQLQVGLATFTPIRAQSIESHRMHQESFTLEPETATAIEAARRRGGRVIAVGTTVMRVLETCADGGDRVSPQDGVTSLYIRPGHTFQVADGLLTNFHQPRSSLLVLLAAFIGEDAWRAAYAHALDDGYRFLSFGDCMLCWRRT
ncbi:MAG: tRNA preQ1(34) S-adenosylmethionine ribosyltransferase-isomerase QueA [Candidatus Dormibacteraeota bacterium]|nr:tRNA preQ1(34) S-adenosylmethionine ribosyltransferase-isomerase QueA [Candidatus Dormibacteraeota bacterium]MBV9525250.1 tRNA preQ1(34) S-adenosylmethionine ribosyltransferase-isomerase QueA [Candidatus Dormibacteraeota bacterium]